MPKVFVSYSCDSDAHRARVAGFVARLRDDSIDVVYDQDIEKVGGPSEGWPRWCERQIVECDYVLACCTAIFHQRFEYPERTDPALGVPWEAQSIRQYLYENPNANRKVRPLIFDDGDRANIPNALRPFSFFVAMHGGSYANLLGWLKAATPVAPAAPPAAVAWPPRDDDFPRRLADRAEQFDRFKSMLAGHGSQRILLAQGPSSSGKTALIHECIAYAEHSGVPHSRVDFKGGLPLEDVAGSLVTDLGEEILREACACEGSAQTQALITDLQQLRRPLFLAFDTFEDASQASQSWIERLLSHIGRCPALVVAVAGRKVPEHTARSWAPFAYIASLPPIKDVDDWYDFVGRTHGPSQVKREHIEALTLTMNGDPGQVSAMLDALVQRLPAG